MLVTVSSELIKDIIELLQQLISVSSERERETLVKRVDLGTFGRSLKEKITYNGDNQMFVVNLVHSFNEFGMVTETDHALHRLLATLKNDFGLDRQRTIDEFLIRITEDVNQNIQLSFALQQTDFPFVNREDEIREILSSLAPAYFVIDGPAGYGKTHLLRELQKRFRDRDWVCAFVSLRTDSSLEQMVQDLIFDINSNIRLNSEFNNGRELGAGFVAEFKHFYPKGFHEQGLVILVDVENGVSESLLQEITQSFIPGVQSTLRKLLPSPFVTQANRFRVILAGRYLSSLILDPLPKFCFCRLTPFTYDVTFLTAHKYLCPTEDILIIQDTLTQIAAHCMFLTGGHPQCIAYALKKYRTSGFDPDEFLYYEGENVIDYVLEVAELAKSNVPRKILDVLDFLCVFRYFDIGVLRLIFEKENPVFVGHIDIHDIVDKLRLTHLIIQKGRLLQDDITRRLLTIKLHHKIGEQDFKDRCVQAQNIYAEYLGGYTFTPERWAIEYLFQFLQQHIDDSRNISERKTIRESFFDQQIPFILQRLTNGRDSKEEFGALEAALKDDWEFRFMVNYILRARTYSNEPYQSFLEQVETFLTRSKTKR